MINKRILVTGGAGFIASNILLKLAGQTKSLRATTHQKDPQVDDPSIEFCQGDLMDADFCNAVCKDVDYVIMAAANTSGAAVMEKTPLAHVTPNVIMNTLMLEAAYNNGVEKFVFLSSNTVYPPVETPVKESDFNGEMFDKYFCVAWMKRFTEVMCVMYSSKIPQPMNTIVVRPGNSYGEYDDFDWETSHVIPSLVRKVAERHNPIEVWGDGKDIKDFIYVGDLVDGILATLEQVDRCLAVNIAAGKSHSINDVLESIFEAANFKPNIKYNADKPSMIPQRHIDISYANSLIGFAPKVSVSEGIRRTYNWYRENKL